MSAKNFFERFKLALKAFWIAFKNPEKVNHWMSQSEETTSIHDRSHLKLLYYLQHSARLVDFLKEDIREFSDEEVGAAVRKIHQDCKEVLEEIVTIRPLRSEEEGAVIQVPKGFSPSELKLVGKIKGEPPFSGVLVHRGWRAHKMSLPKNIGSDVGSEVIAPAEIEIR